MKTQLLVLLLLIALFTIPLCAQEDTQPGSSTDTETVEENPGFGLQSDIFDRVKRLEPDLTQNLSYMSDYTLTPGDIFKLDVSTGIKSDGSISNTQEYTMQLQDNFNLNVPFIGTINVRGRSLPELQDYIISRIKNLMPVQYVNFKLASPAQFNVFVFGGVNQPGYITANPLMGVIEAIATAGGFKPGASYRDVQLIRKQDGEEKRRSIDISRYYTHAEFQANPPLQPGDKVYVPQADIIAKIQGEVKYPGHYELTEEETLKTLINGAGGMRPEADESYVDVMRVDAQGARKTITVPAEDIKNFSIQNGDVVVVHSVSENVAMVTIEGAVFGKQYKGDGPIDVPHQPVRLNLPYYQGITVLAVLDAVGGPTPYLDKDKQAYIRRAETKKRISVDIEKLWSTRDDAYNKPLEPGDMVFVPIQQLSVFVTGEVANPGSFDYRNGMTVSDYILSAGGIDQQTGNPEKIFFLDKLGNRTAAQPTTEVQPGDHIYVSPREQVYVTGEVSSPGAYPYQRGLDVSDYLLQAGGVNQNTANLNRIFFVDEGFNRTKVTLDKEVTEPGTHIFVSKKFLFQTDQVMGNILMTTGWVTSIFGVVYAVVEFINFVQDLAE
jgi:protein involved in polysaccharide export with SLBB domain